MISSKFFNSFAKTNFTRQLFANLNLPKTQNNTVPKTAIKTERAPSYDTAYITPNKMRALETAGTVTYAPADAAEDLLIKPSFLLGHYTKDYSEKDAVLHQWNMQNSCNIYDLLEGKVTLRLGGPTEEEYNTLLEQLQTNGLDKEINWDHLNMEIKFWGVGYKTYSDISTEEMQKQNEAFIKNLEENYGLIRINSTCNAAPVTHDDYISAPKDGDLQERVDFVASRYAVMRSRIKSDLAGDEQAKQLKRLDETFSPVIKSIAKGYAETYGGVYGETEKFESSIIYALNSRISEYESYIESNADFAGGSVK